MKKLIVLDGTTWQDPAKLFRVLAGFVMKGGPGSGYHDHAGRPGEVGGSAPDDTAAPADTPETTPAWTGETHEADPGLTKLDTGAIGEELVKDVIGEFLGVPLDTVNVNVNNAPFDLAGDGIAIEVKAGLASNRTDAQKWRATIGQPGIKERELLKGMTKEEKLVHNAAKRAAILQRKHDLLSKMSLESNKPVRPYTAGVIISGDGKKADVFLVEDFHLVLRWNKYATDNYRVATVDLEQRLVVYNPALSPDRYHGQSTTQPAHKSVNPLLQKALDAAMAEIDADFAKFYAEWKKRYVQNG